MWAFVYLTAFSSLVFLLLVQLFSSSLSESILLEFELSLLPVYCFSTSFFLDSMAFKFLITVLVISSSVLFYSSSYMDDEFNPKRFTFLVLLFVSSMVILIIGGSAPLLILGWDGLGLSSYFLIVHYQSFKSSGSGLITVLSNRIGDIFIIAASTIIFSEVTSWFFLSSSFSFNYVEPLALLLFLGAITKSAMFPYCTWLPEAMAAPTPVSSLVHSSTLVTAGVYLLLRASLWMPNYLLVIVGGVASFTLLLSSGSALFCMDFKKVIALSTLSQLAFMITTLAINLPNIAFFHLITHALFKSSLFMAAGSFIHLGKSNQDMRNMDTSSFSSSSLILISIPILALSGFPFMAGFFSKESIILVSFSSNLNLTLTLSMVLGALLTMLYSMRMLFSLAYVNLSIKMISESYLFDTSKFLLLTLSMTGGWVYIFNNSPYYSMAPVLASFVVSLFFIAWAIWVSSKIIFNPKYGVSWNQFNYLGRVTNSHLPMSQISSSNVMINFWESGWQEVFGPKIISSFISQSLSFVYSFNTLSYNTMISLILLSTFFSLIIL